MNITIIVIDGLGVGELADAEVYGDKGSNTLLHVYKKHWPNLPNFQKLGLLNIDGLSLPKYDNPTAQYARLSEASKGKDSTTGHWEMMGVITENPYLCFPKVISSNVVELTQSVIGKTLCNHSASGTQIIKELGELHLSTKCPILYSSQDSVLQIAVHNDIWTHEVLWEKCQELRETLNKADIPIQRVIARPFYTDENGEFIRTSYRKDFSLNPPCETTLNRLNNNNITVLAVGKIGELFNYNGISETYKLTDNAGCLEKTKELMLSKHNSLIFTNLVETDMLFGHRNDSLGYAQALERIDEFIPSLLNSLNEDDILIFTGDHGNDPTTISTDHSREFVPMIIYSKSLKPKNLGTIQGFDYIGKFVEKMFAYKKGE